MKKIIKNLESVNLFNLDIKEKSTDVYANNIRVARISNESPLCSNKYIMCTYYLNNGHIASHILENKKEILDHIVAWTECTLFLN